MDAGAVACITFDIDAAATHGVSGSIAYITVDDDLAVIHSIANSVLCIGKNGDRRTAEIGSQGITRYTLDGNMFVGHPDSNKSLPTAVGYSTIFLRVSNSVVEFPVIHIFHVDQHLYITSKRLPIPLRGKYQGSPVLFHSAQCRGASDGCP